MNIFLTSLMHPTTSNDFSQVLSNFERTLRSLNHQTNQNFLLVVVCNEEPQLHVRSANLVFHLVDFPAADRDGLDSKRADKGAKLISGLLFAKQYRPDYVYILDADDWLHRRVNEWLMSRPLESGGWYVSAGYTANVSSRKIQKKYGLYRYCGSTFAANYRTLMRLLALDDGLRSSSSKDEILALVPESVLYSVLVSHDYTTFFKAAGFECRRMPFEAAVWVRGTGENIYPGSSAEAGLRFSGKTLDKFGLAALADPELPRDGVAAKFSHALVALQSLLGSLFVKNVRLGKNT